MVMVCRMAEQAQLATVLRNVSKSILTEGGVVRGITNLGDRVLTRNRQTEDGVYHAVGRFMQIQFYASPETRALAEIVARESQETLRVFSLKIKEDDYFRRVMGVVNQELSPFKDEEKKDSAFMREMLDHYRKMEDFESSTTDRQILRHDSAVHAYLKQMEMGRKHPDTKLLQQYQEASTEQDDKKV